MKRNSTLILHAGNSLSWLSCKSISHNLKSAYLSALPQQSEFLEYSDGDACADLLRLARTIHRLKPKNLVFLDHIPHPITCLHAVRIQYGKQPLPSLWFHVYGDFALGARSWVAVEQVLACKTPARFICASQKHLSYLRHFASGAKDGNFALLPFPVDTQRFGYSDRLRGQMRERLGIPTEAKLFLYSGRTSLQKNVALFISAFAEAAAKNRSIYFVQVGSEDDLGVPCLGVQSQIGRYGHQIRQLISKMPPSVRQRIHQLGAVEARHLPALYSAADFYVSLSLHHDEDFGMAPAEALCCGLPVLLTDWGGFSSRMTDPRDGALLPVLYKNGSHEIDRTHLIHQLLRLASTKTELNSRLERSKRHKSHSSIANAASSLKKIFASPPPIFSGFNPLMKQLSFLQIAQKDAPFDLSRGNNSEFYAQVYAPYFEKTTLL